ncbi:ABC transporter permease [Dorea formicigenerans]|uniref:ABC transporter permease n=1 Tax=Dorea formicigenerans TaxID=39486 RepID=UPI001570A37D|nr:ABC transporter permease [Dorea formicigenerans]NSK19078.1 ABC transporter permease [Dorea formicigenerans]
MNYPFENDTERIEKRIAEKSVFSEKNRTFLIRVIILIAAFLLSFSGILLCNATLSTQQIAHVNNTTEAVGTVLGIVIVLLCTAGLAVKNILYVSVLQRVHEFAQLRAIGATYQQIKSVVKKERDKIAKPCIVLGTVIGFLVNIVLPLHFYWIPSIVCAVISGIFIWIITALAFQAPAKMAASTSPIEAQHTQATNYFRSVGAKRKLTPIRIGWMYCRANRKKAAYTFLSLIMSGILMFGVFSILNAINPERLASQPYQGNSDVFVLLNSTADEESTYDLMKSTPFTEEKKQKLYNISGVKDVYELYMLDGILTNSEGEKFELSIENAVNPETFKNEIVEGMQPSHELQNGAIPVAINRQSPYYQKLNMQLQVGDYLPYIIDTGYGQKEVELVVSGFVENSDTGLVIYTSGENMKSLSEMNCTLAWYICLDDNGKDVATEIIKEIFIDDDRVDVSVLADDVMALEDYFHNAKVIITVLVVLISLFSFINMLNTSITNAIARRHDYALLEATGMTKLQLRKVQQSESFIYLVGSFIGSCILGIPIGLLLCTQISKIPGLSYFEYNFPVLFVLLYFAAVVMVYHVVSVYQKKSLQQHSIIERIRTIG